MLCVQRALAVAAADGNQRARIVAAKSHVTNITHGETCDNAPDCLQDFAADICVCMSFVSHAICDSLAAAISQTVSRGAMFILVDCET